MEKGEVTAIEAIDGLLSEEYATRETRRIDVALRTAKLMPTKTLEGFDFSFQPSLDRERIAALARHFWGKFKRRWQQINQPLQGVVSSVGCASRCPPEDSLTAPSISAPLCPTGSPAR